MSCLFHLMREQYRLRAQRAALSTQLQKLPEGSLSFHRNGKSWKWRCRFDNVPEKQSVKTILHRERAYAEKLALRRYLTEKIQVIDRKLACLERFQQEYPVFEDLTDSMFEPCDDYRALLGPLLEKDRRILEWSKAPFPQSKEHPDHLNIQTKSGAVVRSKSESIIADALFEHGIAFRYEQSVYFGEIQVFPDFTILDPKDPSREVIWEHFGLIDNEYYARNAKQKMIMYIDAGFVEGHNLITTYESKEMPLDINYVEALIDYHFA